MSEKITCQCLGGDAVVVDDVETVGEAREAMGLPDTYQASVNGDPAEDSDPLDSFSYVNFAPKVKGGRK